MPINSIYKVAPNGTTQTHRRMSKEQFSISRRLLTRIRIMPWPTPVEALQRVRHVLDQNPLDISASGELSCAAYYARRYDEAIDYSQQTMRMDKGFVNAHYYSARALGQKQMYQEAITELNTAMQI